MVSTMAKLGVTCSTRRRTLGPRAMNPTALVISHSPRSESVSFKNAASLAIGLSQAGYSLTFAMESDLRAAPKSLAYGDFDLICYQAPDNGLHRSSAAHLRLYTHLHREAKDNAVAIFYCDVALQFQPTMWDNKIGKEETKRNFMAERPVRILGSFSHDILDDQKAMGLIHRKVMSKVHPDSTFLPVEWLAFNHALAEGWGEFANAAQSMPKTIDRFYYGLDKRKLVPSLERMGLGQSERDAVVGSIARAFPKVRNLGDSDKGGRHPWLEHAQAAKSVLIPYEPLKGDYQLTLRLLEALQCYPETAVLDPQIADWMQPLAREHAPWKQRMAQAVERMAQIEPTPQRRKATSFQPPKSAPTRTIRSKTMTLATIKYTDLTTEADAEGERPFELYTRDALISKLAPGFDTDDPVDAEDSEKWLDAFAKDPLAQRAQRVSVEILDVNTLYEEAEAAVASKVAELKQAEATLGEVAAAVLRQITEEQVAEGEVHPLTPTSKTYVNIVEFYRKTKIKKSASTVLDENKNLPSHVKKVLEARAAADKIGTAARTQKKNKKS